MRTSILRRHVTVGRVLQRGHFHTSLWSALVMVLLVGSDAGRLRADQPERLPASQTQSAEERAEIVELLEKAIPTAARYTVELTNIVAEEKYVQRSHAGGDNLRNMEQGAGSSRYRLGTRTLLSDFLMVWVPDVNGWIEYRDVYEKDGEPVRDRENRLEALFIRPAPDSRSRARVIMDESARYNLGNIGRDFNMPTFALRVLHPSHVGRFRFKSGGTVTLGTIRSCKIDFDEMQEPTLITNVETGTDIFSTGSFWLDCATGRVVQSLLMVASLKLNIRARITVQFREEPKLGIWVPYRMVEVYDRPQVPGSYRVDCEAEYTNFRKFQVIVDETVISDLKR